MHHHCRHISRSRPPSHVAYAYIYTIAATSAKCVISLKRTVLCPTVNESYKYIFIEHSILYASSINKCNLTGQEVVCLLHLLSSDFYLIRVHYCLKTVG